MAEASSVHEERVVNMGKKALEAVQLSMMSDKQIIDEADTAHQEGNENNMAAQFYGEAQSYRFARGVGPNKERPLSGYFEEIAKRRTTDAERARTKADALAAQASDTYRRINSATSRGNGSQEHKAA